jgi:hypothetical protein
MASEYQRVAAQFGILPKYTANWPQISRPAAEHMKRADKFERDARMIELDAELIAETKALLRRTKMPNAGISSRDRAPSAEKADASNSK